MFSSLPDAEVRLVWKTIEDIQSDTLLTIRPTTTFGACPRLDVICVPGGYGTDALLCDGAHQVDTAFGNLD